MNRELIRLANRERLNATEVKDLLEFSANLLTFYREPLEGDTLTATETASALFDTWKQSYDEP